jgi:hypothetical protein
VIVVDRRDETTRAHVSAALALTDRLSTLRETELLRFLLTCDVGFLEDLVERFDVAPSWRITAWPV